MKSANLIWGSAILLCFTLLLADPASALAQGKSNKKSKMAKKETGPPPWAPAHGYRAKTRYVYFKDYNVYYDHERGVYISLSGRNWQVTARLPSLLSGIDLKAAVKVDLDFSGDDPQKNNIDHKAKFAKH